MENPCKILCFGDSLTNGYFPIFEQMFRKGYPDIDATFINAGIGGETTRDGLKRLPTLLNENPGVTLICFGMNDENRGISSVELAQNLSKMVDEFQNINSRVLLLTLNPVRNVEINFKIDIFNQIITDVAYEKRIRVVDVNSLWKKEINPWAKGLCDTVHPNTSGYEIYAKALLRVVPRRNIILLWQYNGNPAECNYSCPYCSYDPNKQKGHYFQGTIESWHNAFKKTFGNQHLVFYFGHGEPMVGKRWFDVVELVGSEPNWEMRVISNISPTLDKLLKSKVSIDGRLNINASFHPTETTKEKFLKKLLQCREQGIEVPVVYTMWPPFLNRFEDDFAFFNKYNFLVHVRRFRGWYNGIQYPEAYTDDERKLIASYCDDATIKYMLSNELTDGKLTWTGVDFIILDNEGNVGYCDDFRTDHFNFGNVFQQNVKLLVEPSPFPKYSVSDGTVDGVSCILELGQRQLEGNHILHFARQGGVYHIPQGVFYKNKDTNFNDSRIRAEYLFPPRNITDCYYILSNRNRDLNRRVCDVLNYMLPFKLQVLKSTFNKYTTLIPFARPLYRYLRKMISL